MYESLIFLLGSIVFVRVSWFSILNPHSHGFFRFLAWEAIFGLVLLNIPMWTKNPFSILQLISWALLTISILLALHAFHLLHSIGKPNGSRNDPELFSLEKTSILVKTGAYRFIRHPIYAALLYLAWGAFLKDISIASLLLATAATIAILFTSLREEEECKLFFGLEYVEYIKTTKRFVPFFF